MFNQKKYMKQYREDNYEKIKERQRQYNKKHCKEIRENCKKYYKEHHEELLKKAKQYAKDNHEKRIKYMKQYREERSGWINDYKLSKGCSICGYNKCAAALDFHHPNDDKEFTIAKFRNKNISIEKIKLEIEKCEVLCCRCHRELHFKKMK